MRKLLLFLILIYFAIPVWGQAVVSPAVSNQVRTIAHLSIDLKGQFYVPIWQINNIRQNQPNNQNWFTGLGYRGEHWWLEGMIQRQFSGAGNHWILDFRYQQRFGQRWNLYVEPAPFLTKKSFYNFEILEYRTWRRLNLGAETENLHRPGIDSLGMGPRLSFPVRNFSWGSLSLALAYQFRRQESNAFRVYLVTNVRLRP